jgi:hypothetical protein
MISMLYILHGALNFMASARLFYLLYLSVILSLKNVLSCLCSLSFSFFTPSFFVRPFLYFILILLFIDVRLAQSE